MEVKINIERKGEQPGTVGWLCDNAATIELGCTKNDKRGAWLKDREGKTITALAIQDWFGMDDPGYHKVQRGPDTSGADLTAGRVFTDAAWQIIRELADIAVQELEQDSAENVSVNITRQA